MFSDGFSFLKQSFQLGIVRVDQSLQTLKGIDNRTITNPNSNNTTAALVEDNTLLGVMPENERYGGWRAQVTLNGRLESGPLNKAYRAKQGMVEGRRQCDPVDAGHVVAE